MLRHHHHDSLFQRRKAEQLHEFVQVASVDPHSEHVKARIKLDLLDTQKWVLAESAFVRTSSYACVGKKRVYRILPMLEVYPPSCRFQSQDFYC